MTQSIDRETAISLAKEAGFWTTTNFVEDHVTYLEVLANLAVAHSRKDAEPVSKLTFEAAWAEMEKRGYRYGRDALAGVKFGWKLHEDWNTTNPPEADKLLQQALEVLEQYPIPTNDAKSDRLVLALRTYLEGKK